MEDFKQRIPRSEAEELIQLVSDAADKAYGPKQAVELRSLDGAWENDMNVMGEYWTLLEMWDTSLI